MHRNIPADSFIGQADATIPMACGIVAAEDPGIDLVIEDFNISGDTLMSQITALIGQGNVHRIAIKNSEGHTLLSVPTHQNALDNRVDTIPSFEATAIKVISAIVDYPKVIVERFA